MASYPSVAKTFTTKLDGEGNFINAEHINALQDEVTAIETALLAGLAHDLTPSTDNARDLGAALARWRDLFVGRNVLIGGTLGVTGLSSFGALGIGNVRGTVEAIAATGTVANQAVGATTTILRFSNAGDLTIQGFTGGVDGRLLILESVGAGHVHLAHQDASATAENRLINSATSGKTSLAAGSGTAIYQYDGTTARWRLIQHEQGAWITPAFAAGDYTGAGAMTVTVAAGDVGTYAYRLSGRQLTVATYVNTATIGGVASTSVQVKIPGGFTAAKTMATACWINDNGTKRMGLASVTAVGTNILISQAPDDGATWAAAADTSYWRVTITLEVQ